MSLRDDENIEKLIDRAEHGYISVRELADAIIAAAERRGEQRPFSSTDDSMKNACRNCGQYHDGLCDRRSELGQDTPWPLSEVLTRLADAADHLLKDHDCDRHGWEGVTVARDAARKYVAEIARRSGEGQEPQGDVSNE